MRGVLMMITVMVMVKVTLMAIIMSTIVGWFEGPTQLAHDDPAPLSANGLIRGRRLVSYQFISSWSEQTNNRVNSDKQKPHLKVSSYAGSKDVDPLTVWVLLINTQPARDHYRKWKFCPISATSWASHFHSKNVSKISHRSSDSKYHFWYFRSLWGDL